MNVKKNNKPHIILISGPSAAGKTTLCDYLVTHYSNEYEHIRQDDYLKNPSTFPIFGEFRVWEEPENIMFDTLIKHILKLKAGKKVEWRTFSKHEEEPVHRYTIMPKHFILIDGSLILSNKQMLDLGDEKIYLDIPVEVSLSRRASRSKFWGIDLSFYDKAVYIPSYAKYRYLKDHADHIIDGTKTIEEIAEELRKIVHTI
jgi:uridine kinase